MTKRNGSNRYSRVIEAIFSKYFQEGVSEIDFSGEEIAATADELNIELPKNLGDMIYSFRYRRSLPRSITTTAPNGFEWVLQPGDRSKYKLALVKQSPILILSKQKKSPDVFISYSHKDKEYAHALVAEFERNLLLAWIDDRIDYGAQWPKEIEDHINACPIFVIIMSINAYQSIWVHNELSFAQMKKKTIFPLLLDGENWLSLAAIQYADVRGGKMPSERFFTAIKNRIGGTFSSSGANVLLDRNVREQNLPELSEEAKQILIELSLDPEGRLTVAENVGDMIIATHGKDLENFKDSRTRAAWKDAIIELENHQFLRRESKTKYSISTRGYQVADILKALAANLRTTETIDSEKSKVERTETTAGENKHEKLNQYYNPWYAITNFEEFLLSQFPGKYGFIQIAPENATETFMDQLSEQVKKYEVWWTDGMGNSSINEIRKLDNSIWLMANIEININSVWIYRGFKEYQHFVMLECNPMPKFGFSRLVGEFDEAAWYKGRYIRREEYDDDYATIDDEVIKLNGEAEPRVRWIIKKYIFIGPNGSNIKYPGNDDTVLEVSKSLLAHGVPTPELLAPLTKLKVNSQIVNLL